MNNSANKYFIRNTDGGAFQDITTLFDGVAILKIDGMLAKGKPINVFTQQWLSNQKEDFLITTLNSSGNPVVIRENIDLEITFIIRQKYANATINVLSVHDSFINYMTGSDVWIKSSYVGNKYVHCVCLSEYSPTTVSLQRGDNSYIMGTIKLHTLDTQHV